MGYMGRSRDKKIRIGPIIMILVMAAALGLLVFMRTSYFCIKDITVLGNSFVNEQEIIEYAGITPGKNILSVKVKELEKKLNTHPYILSAQVQRNLPDGIEITVKERDLVGYVPFMGSFLLLDSEGRVISAAARKPVEGLPVYQGIKVENFQEREILDIDNIQIFDKIIYISKCIAQNLAGYSPIEVNVEDTDNIVIDLDGRFVIRVGDTEGLEYKLQYSNTILEKLFNREIGGEIDVSHGEKAFYRPW
jgi:cell division protein FtsQ